MENPIDRQSSLIRTLLELLTEANREQRQVETGACIVRFFGSDHGPADPTNTFCVEVTPQQCVRMGGQIRGGDCEDAVGKLGAELLPLIVPAVGVKGESGMEHIGSRVTDVLRAYVNGFHDAVVLPSYSSLDTFEADLKESMRQEIEAGGGEASLTMFADNLKLLHYVRAKIAVHFEVIERALEDGF